MDATLTDTPTSNCSHCAARGSDRQWNPRTLRQGLCKKGYAEAKADGTLSVKRLPKGQRRQCKVVAEGVRCSEDAKAHEMCPTHVARYYRGANLDAPLRSGTGRAPECTFDGCTKPLHADGLCAGHSTQRQRGKELTPLRSYKPRAGACAAEWEGERCPRDVANDGLCQGHYDRRGRMDGAEGWQAPIRKKGPHGEGYVTDDGYKMIYVNGRRVREHIHVKEQELGRKLLPKETVHHKNGQRLDNRPSNLELWSHAQPAGQRVEDKVTFAREMLALYGTLDERQRYAEALPKEVAA